VKGRICFYFLVLTLWVSTALAVVVKDLHFESNPSDADVFLLQGTKQVPLGKTPLKYQAEFHSDISILRFTLKKIGYETQTIEVSAKQDRVVVKLPSQDFAARPSTINDPTLRSLQQRLAPTIDRTLQKVLALTGPYDFELAGHLRVTRLDDKILLILPIELRNTKDKADPTDLSQNEVFLKKVWDQFGGSMVIPIIKAIRGERLLNGILLDVGYSRLRHGFEVSSHVESSIEMQCVPGTEARQVYNSCIRRKIETTYDSKGRTWSRDVGCEGGFETQMVFDPCLTKIPVTHTEVKIDPKATIVAVRSRAQYIFPIELIEAAVEQDNMFSQLGILLTNEKGETVIKRGLIPSSLPRIQKND